jgi:redox-sensitive bicupin YhaK (pirin superfamily)
MRFVERNDMRGKSDLGWLHSRFTYSFAEYFNPKRMGFGVLRVVNDDAVDQENGFPLHHHENMEIITVMLEGTLTHEDSMGNKKEITAGEIQVMSAGTGVNHSEWNHEKTVAAKLLQIWILPDKKGHTPRYDQKRFEEQERHNQFAVIVLGKQKEGALFINQDAVIARAQIEEGKNAEYVCSATARGIFVFVISGKVQIGEDILEERDVMEISNEQSISLTAQATADVLVIDVPL